MRTSFCVCCSIVGLVLGLPSLPAQTPDPATAQSAPEPRSSTAVLKAGASIVLVDVVVSDHDGNPVHGLTAQDFHVTEDKQPQATRSFEEITEAARSNAPKLPPLPPGVFTDYEPVAKGPLNVLLVDAMNTPLNAQIYLREQLRDYIRHAPSGARIAIFGLNAGLTMLQGFTTDPAVLRTAIDYKVGKGRSAVLNDAAGTNNGSDRKVDGLEELTDPALGRQVLPAVEMVRQFESEVQARQTQVRILDTINAFTVLGHYLASFSGRKNVVWFSGSFPINILPDPTVYSPFAITQNNSNQFRAMVNLLAQAEVSVYPVDARALQTTPMYDAARTGSPYVSNGGAQFNTEFREFNSSQADEHATMQTLANQTGGKAFFNTNALADAVRKSIDTGANYYTLSYTPTNRTQDGSFRSINVELAGQAAARGYTLAYRHGYYASSPSKSGERMASAGDDAKQGAASAASASPTPPEAIAMGHGAPAPSELLFKVRLVPASRETEPTAAPGSHVNGARAKPPFQRYAVDFAALPAQLQLTVQPNGQRTGHVEFVVYVFDATGNLDTSAGQSLDLDLTPAQYKALLQEGLKLHLEVSAPAKGEHFFRLALHDLESRKMGVVEISSLAVPGLEAAPASHPAGTSSR